MARGGTSGARPSPQRFAQAVFQLGLERNELGKWTRDLAAMTEALQSDELRAFLEHERVPMSSKQAVVEQMLPDLGPLARNLLLLLASRRDLELLPGVHESFQGLLDSYYGRQRVQVITAVPLTEEQQQRIQAFLSQFRNGKELVMETRVDPSILGGLVVRVGSRLMDGSTKTRLAALRRQLAEGSLTAAGA